MRVVILGGGISGLSAAWFYQKKYPDHKITLLEKMERLGGWIDKVQENGFVFEKGPRTLACSRSPKLQALIEEVGLKEELLFSLPSAKKRFLWTGGKLCKPSAFWPSLIYSVLKEAFFVPPKQLEDESIYSFAARRFGPKIARNFFDPLILGIYAGDIHRLSIRSCLPFLWQAEQTHGSVVRSMFKKKRGKSGLFTLRHGLSQLVERLQESLRIEIVTNCEVNSLFPTVSTSRGQFAADRIISALPAFEMERLTNIPLKIPHRSIWVVHIGFSSLVLPKKGFGYLVPTEEKENLLGMVWDSEVFAIEEKTRLTAMIREESQDPIQDALSALERHLGVIKKPDYLSSHLAVQAIPQFEVGHYHKIADFQEKIAQQFPHLYVTGNYLEGASLEACVARSQQIVQAM